jgi:hypothetical protein
VKIGTWDGLYDDMKSAPIGVYIYRVETPSLTTIGKLVVIR